MITITPTPNPNAVKLTTETPIVEGALVVTTDAESGGHPLARALIAIPGVTSIYLSETFVTVTKDATAPWERILPDVEIAVREHLR